MSEPKEQPKQGLNIQIIIVLLSIITSMITVAGTFLLIGEFKGMMQEKVGNIERNVERLTNDHEKRIRDIEFDRIGNHNKVGQ